MENSNVFKKLREKQTKKKRKVGIFTQNQVDLNF